MSRAAQFSWTVGVLPGLAEQLAEELTALGYWVTAEHVRAELARPELKREEIGQAVTGVLRDLWDNKTGYFFGPSSYFIYSHGEVGLRQEVLLALRNKRIHLSHAARRRARMRGQQVRAHHRPP